MIGVRGPRIPAHQITTRNLGAAYPFIAEAGLGQRGVVIGDDLLGGSFVFDPFELYAQGVVSNPNMVVFGQIGRGKSAFVKTFLWRQAVFGRKAWVVDPKGEYGDLAAAWGVRPVALRPGGAIRLNPLDPGPGHGSGVDGEGSTARRQMELLSSLASACLGRSLLPRERAALGVALVSATERADVPTVPSVVEELLAPTAASAASLRTELHELLEDGRDVALELRRLVHGDLCGMFDGPTTSDLDLSAPLVVLDLSALYTSAALGILMACATAWLQAALARASSSARGATVRTSGQVFLVVDEAWAILSNLGVARWLQSSWKLSRAFGVSNLAVLHRVSDLRSVGASDSEQVALAQGLLADSETRVIYAQSPGELALAGELLSLSATESDLLPQLRRGVALWKVGQRSFLVQHRLSPMERLLVDTDGAMTSRQLVNGLTATVMPLAFGGAVIAAYSFRHGGGPERRLTGRSRGARWARRRDLGPLLLPLRRPHPGRLALGATAGGGSPASGGGRTGAVVGGGGADPEREDQRPGRAGHIGVGGTRAGGQRQERPAATHPTTPSRIGPGVVHRSDPVDRGTGQRMDPARRLLGVAEGATHGGRSVRNRQSRRHDGRWGVLVRHGGETAGPAPLRRGREWWLHGRRGALGRPAGGR